MLVEEILLLPMLAEEILFYGYTAMHCNVFLGDKIAMQCCPHLFHHMIRERERETLLLRNNDGKCSLMLLGQYLAKFFF